MAIIAYILRRIFSAAVVFTLVGFVSFGIVCLLPGDYYTPMEWMIHVYDLDPDLPNILRAEKGLDKPFIVQFLIWFEGVVLHGDFGFSYRTNGSVGDYIFQAGGPTWMTLLVAGPPMVLAWIVGIPLGALSALIRGRAGRAILDIVGYPLLSIPAYVHALIIQWFVFKVVDPLFIGPGLWGICGWTYIDKPMSLAKFGSCVLHLMPIMFVIGAPVAVMVARIMRDSMRDELNRPHVLVARGKGLRERRLFARHAARNALNPLISLFGTMLPTLMMNTIIVGHLFNIPTFGHFLLETVRLQDQHVVTAALLFYGAILIVGSLISDLGLLWCDPRIRTT